MRVYPSISGLKTVPEMSNRALSEGASTPPTSLLIWTEHGLVREPAQQAVAVQLHRIGPPVLASGAHFSVFFVSLPAAIRLPVAALPMQDTPPRVPRKSVQEIPGPNLPDPAQPLRPWHSQSGPDEAAEAPGQYGPARHTR